MKTPGQRCFVKAVSAWVGVCREAVGQAGRGPRPERGRGPAEAAYALTPGTPEASRSTFGGWTGAEARPRGPPSADQPRQEALCRTNRGKRHPAAYEPPLEAPCCARRDTANSWVAVRRRPWSPPSTSGRRPHTSAVRETAGLGRRGTICRWNRRPARGGCRRDPRGEPSLRSCVSAPIASIARRPPGRPIERTADSSRHSAR